MSDLAIANQTAGPAKNEGGPQVVSGRFGNFDELAEAIQGFDLDFRQIDAGTMSSEFLQIGTGAALLTRARFGRRFHQRGGSPPGLRTFALVEEGVSRVNWCGREMGQADLASFDSRGDFEAVSNPDFGVYTLSFPEEHLADVAAQLGLPALDELVGENDLLVSTDPGRVAGLRRSLTDLCEAVVSDMGSNRVSSRRLELIDELEFGIPGRLLAALAGSKAELREPPARLRDAAVERAVSIIEASVADPVSVKEVCTAAGASWRTLNYAFRERFGVTPKVYMKSVRLNAAYDDLRVADPAAKVADIANRYGFWHMGQFAADFRKQFGELPSERLGRASRGAATVGLATLELLDGMNPELARRRFAAAGESVYEIHQRLHGDGC